ncbi:MAG: PqqD family peptide modification chaperone [Romboutsia sp.]
MDNKEVLDIVFKVSDAVEYEVNKEGIVTVLEKQDHKVQRFFRKLKFKIPMYKKTTLDNYASSVFLQIDGKKTIEEIGSYLDNKYGIESHPLYERLLLFLNHVEINCNYIERLEK